MWSPGKHPMTTQLQRELDRVLAGRRIPLAVLHVERGDGSFQWSGAGGRARPDGAAMTVDTPFNIASIDKICTVTLMLRLHEQRHLDLDAPMVRYLPAALTDGLHRLKGTDYTSQVTIRHLASHTSGLAGYFEDIPKGGVSFADRLFSEADVEWSTPDLLAIARDQLTPHFPPQPAGSARPRVRYSDTNFLLLMAIIEAVAGQSLAVLAHEQIFKPAGLRHTWYWERSVPVEMTHPAAAVWFGSTALDRPLGLKSLRCVYSTAADLARLMRALVSGRFFDQPGTWSLMQNWHSLGVPRDMASLRLPGWPIQYGLGLMRFKLPRLFTPFQAMPAIIGHTGSSGTWLFHCPERDLYIAGGVSEVTSGAVPFRLVPRLLRLFGPAP